MILGIAFGALLLALLVGLAVTFWLARERTRLLDENVRLRRLLADATARN